MKENPMQLLVTGILLIAFASVLGFYGTQLAREGWSRLASPPASAVESIAVRPYVIVANSELVTSTDPTKSIQIRFSLKNTGQTLASGSFNDFTYYFSTNEEQREFPYQPSKPLVFSLAPSEEWTGYFLPSFSLSPEKLQFLDEGKARLFFYARGEYHDANGNTYKLPFAQMYNPDVPGRLVISPSTIQFTLPDIQVDQGPNLKMHRTGARTTRQCSERLPAADLER
jgi:hypothetical protein